MKPASIAQCLLLGLLLAAAGPALAHGYRFGDLEIIHPAVMVPSGQADCSCAHVKIVNHGAATEYLLGASIAVAQRTYLISIATGQGLAMPLRLAIAPGATLDLSSHQGCLFMSGITTTLEADMGVIPGRLRFERQGPIDIEFMIDAAGH